LLFKKVFGQKKRRFEIMETGLVSMELQDALKDVDSSQRLPLVNLTGIASSVIIESTARSSKKEAKTEPTIAATNKEAAKRYQYDSMPMDTRRETAQSMSTSKKYSSKFDEILDHKLSDAFSREYMMIKSDSSIKFA
jgi:type II secretory pathway component HofQ